MLQVVQSPHVFLTEDNYWFVDITSQDKFKQLIAGIDIPITSNLFLITKELSNVRYIYDSYRPAPEMDIRLVKLMPSKV